MTPQLQAHQNIVVVIVEDVTVTPRLTALTHPPFTDVVEETLLVVPARLVPKLRSYLTDSTKTAGQYVLGLSKDHRVRWLNGLQCL